MVGPGWGANDGPAGPGAVRRPLDGLRAALLRSAAGAVARAGPAGSPVPGSGAAGSAAGPESPRSLGPAPGVPRPCRSGAVPGAARRPGVPALDLVSPPPQVSVINTVDTSHEDMIVSARGCCPGPAGLRARGTGHGHGYGSAHGMLGGEHCLKFQWCWFVLRGQENRATGGIGDDLKL